MAKIDISGFPLGDYAHERHGLPIFALRNRTDISLGTVLFGIMLRECLLRCGDTLCLVIDGKEYACPIINITRESDGVSTVCTTAQQVEAGEILHLLVPPLEVEHIKSGPVLAYAEKPVVL